MTALLFSWTMFREFHRPRHRLSSDGAPPSAEVATAPPLAIYILFADGVRTTAFAWRKGIDLSHGMPWADVE